MHHFAGERRSAAGRRDAGGKLLCFMAQGCRHARVCLASTASSKTKSHCLVWELPVAGGWRDDEHVLQLHVVQLPADDLQVRHRNEEVDCLPHGRHSGFKPENYETKQIFTPATTARACRCFWSTRKA